jgi:hypothetical protein
MDSLTTCEKKIGSNIGQSTLTEVSRGSRPFRKIPESIFLGHDHLLTNHLKFIINLIILSSDAVSLLTASFNNQQHISNMFTNEEN